MRLLVLSNLYPPDVVGGYERLCHEVATALSGRGHAVTVLTSARGRAAGHSGLSIRREWRLLAGEEIYDPFPGGAAERAAVNADNLAALERAIRETRPEAIFAWNLFFLDASILDALERAPVPVLAMLTDNWLLVMRDPGFVAAFFRDHVHGTAPFAPPPPDPLDAARALAGRLLRRLRGERRRRLDAVFGSAFVRDLYRAGGARFGRAEVVHNGVRPLPGSEAPPPDRGRLVEPGHLRLLFAGRLVDLKGAHTAVEALALLDPAALGVSRVSLTLLGDGQDAAYLARLREAVAASGRAGAIALRPAVPEAALNAVFDEHDLYLFPSLYEPFSLTLLHALARGIPTVASRAGGNPEAVRDGEGGLLFERGDATGLARAVSRLATDPALRRRVSEGGRRAASAFTFERMLEGMERALRGAS